VRTRSASGRSRAHRQAPPATDSVEIMNIIGDVEGKNAVLFDDR
jgi:phosphoribosylpyrophosphate synthetase